jgi:hypothetical protein
VVSAGSTVACYAVDCDNTPLHMRPGNFHTSLTLSLLLTTSNAQAVAAGGTLGYGSGPA